MATNYNKTNSLNVFTGDLDGIDEEAIEEEIGQSVEDKVETLQNEIDGNRNQINGFNNQLNLINQDVTTFKEDVTQQVNTLGETVTENETKIQNLDTRVTAIESFGLDGSLTITDGNGDVKTLTIEKGKIISIN